MTEPRIQYAKTSDGVNIAFTTFGEGEPLVWALSPAASHVQLEWHEPSTRALYTAAAQLGMVVRFDGRGAGLSDRDVDDVSLDARVRDLEAVADQLHLKSFVLLALDDAGLMAIAYAARHSRRVSRLVLMDCYSRGGDVKATPRGKAIYSLADEDDWEMLTESLASSSHGVGTKDAERMTERYRAATTPEMLRRWLDATIDIDVSPLLPHIRVPTLVVRHSGIKWVTMDATKELASSIPDARLLVIEGLVTDNAGQLFSGVVDFLGVGEQPESKMQRLPLGDVHTILFTDVEGSTALTDRLGDAKARELLREHERMVREALKAHGGSEVKTMGDGFMASFSSATRALECAIAIQSAFADRNESAEEPIKVRIGLNAGEPIAEDDADGRGDLFGTAVNLAARIAGKAEGGEILVADVVRQLVAGKEFLFNDRGDTELRGFEDPVRLYEVSWREG